jgi:hypothetical protein
VFLLLPASAEGRLTDKEERGPMKHELEVIPGIGPSMTLDLLDLGVERVVDLRGRDPEEMYTDLCEMRGTGMDRCVLYVFRCAVYFAESAEHDPELLKWWNWTDERMPGQAG